MRHWYGPGPRRTTSNASARRRKGGLFARLSRLCGAFVRRVAAPFAGRRGGPALSIVVSCGVHGVLVALLAVALRGVAHHGGGSIVSLDLGSGPHETASFEPPRVDVRPPEREPAPADRAADADRASRELQGVVEQIRAVQVTTPTGSSVPRGSGSAAAPLLDRGPSAAPGLSGLDASAMAPALDGASFAGVSAQRARSVVYAVDASGAMVTSLPFVLEELRRSISALAADQSFAVVLFGRRAGDDEQGAGVRVFPGEGLRAATPTAKAEVFTWLDRVQARGASNPLDGLLAAMDREPEVVFLLSRSIRRTDGQEAAEDWGPGREAILAELNRANPVRKSIFGPPARAVQVKCVQFLEEDPTGVMRAIAEVHGGGTESYRLLPESELRRR